MKRITCILMALLAISSLPAAADFTTVAKAHEVYLSDFRAPASLNGVAGFKPCRDCKQMAVRVTPETRYILNDRDVQLKEFRDAISRVSNREDETVIVMHHLETDTLLSVSIRL